jgi:hypothetical protein
MNRAALDAESFHASEYRRAVVKVHLKFHLSNFGLQGAEDMRVQRLQAPCQFRGTYHNADVPSVTSMQERISNVRWSVIQD